MREREWDLRKDIGFDRSFVTYVMLKVPSDTRHWGFLKLATKAESYILLPFCGFTLA